MLADKDIDAAMNLLSGGKTATCCETQLSEMSDKYSTRRTDLAMNTYPSIGNPKFHELLQKMRQMYETNYLRISERLQGRRKHF
jgi:hypothetical protein